MRVGPSFVPLTPFHHAKAAWQKGSATKARLVNKLELFLANVYAPRIEGSTFFSLPPLSSRSRSRVVRRLRPEGGQRRVLGFLWRIDEIRLKSNYKSDNHFQSFTIFQRVLTVVETKEKLEYWLYSVHNTRWWWWFKETGGYVRSESHSIN